MGFADQLHLTDEFGVAGIVLVLVPVVLVLDVVPVVLVLVGFVLAVVVPTPVAVLVVLTPVAVAIVTVAFVAPGLARVGIVSVALYTA